MKRNILITSLFAVAILLSSCNDSDSLEAQREKLKELKTEEAKLQKQIRELEASLAEKDTTAPDPGRLVAVQQPQEKPFVHFIEVQGAAESKQNIQVTPEVSGVVEQIYVNEGDKVNKGQILARVNDDALQKNLTELQTTYSLAKETFERQKRLWEQNIGSEMQYLQAKNQKERLENQLASMKTQIGKTRITAPISGTIDQVMLNKGEMASQMQPAFQLVNLNEIEVKANVSESFLGQVKKGDSVTVNFPSLGMERRARIKYVSQVVNPNDRTFRVDVAIPNNDGQIKPNVVANVRIEDYRNPNALILPTHAIQNSRNGDYVYVVNSNNGQQVAQKKFVETGHSFKGETEIKSGLTTDEQVVVKGYHTITEGEPLRLESQTAGK